VTAAGPVLAGPALAEALAAVHAAITEVPGWEPWGQAAIAKQLILPGVFGLLHPAGGMVLARVAADEAEILTLAVHPAAQRRGVGSALLRAATAEAAGRGARAMFLEVAAANGPACRLYAAHGFVVAGRRRTYYADGEDALVMRALLPEAPVSRGGSVLR